MLLKSKKTNQRIKVLAKRNKILNNKGFVIILQGNVNGSTKVRKDIIEDMFNIPENVTI